MPGTISTKRLWASRIIGGFAALFLAFDGVIKFFPIATVTDTFTQLGYPVNLAVTIGVLELVLLAIYLIPRTSIVGAILFTGYLGGAISTHVRVGNPLFSHVLFPVYIAALLWGALYLRDSRVRALITAGA